MGKCGGESGGTKTCLRIMNKNHLPRSWRRANDSRIRKEKQNDDRAEEFEFNPKYVCEDCGTPLDENDECGNDKCEIRG